jgi:hypothetical protein
MTPFLRPRTSAAVSRPNSTYAICEAVSPALAGAAFGVDEGRTMHLRRPSSVAPYARPRVAPKFSMLFCEADWEACLNAARKELRTWGEVVPALALPPGQDPALYKWPVAGRRVGIYGHLEVPRLRRLLAALLRDGALVAGVLDTGGALHVASVAARTIAPVPLKEEAE